MSRPIIALDFGTMAQVKRFLKQFNEPLFVKVGMELYLQNGPGIIKEIRSMGHDIFLDLKLYDIPNTVARAMAGLGKLDVQMTNVHAQGGKTMMNHANEAFKSGNPEGTLIAVTQLTSMNDSNVKDEQKSILTLQESVKNYAMLAKQAGLDGVVSSPLESEMIHEHCGSDFLTITPGIRLNEDSKDDQVRVVTPAAAHRLGTDFIVVGRSVTQAAEPVEKYRMVKEMWESGDELS
ncbi:orotidine-5'-phosphate decarboxylase [Salinicoccus halodurans]|uniref:Orotidine 5'-phosphate decarboxylase n=1 Tax=Salinicoccus halodurans TaxID=407035 RepID=A0A0F7HKM0_9STAP|nr:orotidine 5'-phosphate decarboxylase [Salinicoccus halodurans]SFK54868.1 orotidine-5'-phosphate decarboxylase [Salinicoccus halodurans]